MKVSEGNRPQPKPLLSPIPHHLRPPLSCILSRSINTPHFPGLPSNLDHLQQWLAARNQKAPSRSLIERKVSGTPVRVVTKPLDQNLADSVLASFRLYIEKKHSSLPIGKHCKPPRKVCQLVLGFSAVDESVRQSLTPAWIEVSCTF